MQSVVKLSEASNIYKLSDHANGEEDASSHHSDDMQKNPAAAALSNKDGGTFGSLEVSDEKPAAEKPGADSQSSADDALAWLKIIQNVTADLTADLRSSKGDDFDHPFADKTSSFSILHPKKLRIRSARGKLQRREPARGSRKRTPARPKAFIQVR